MGFEREGWSAEQVDATGTRRWVYVARDAEPGNVQRGTVRVDPNVDSESDPVSVFGSECVEAMESAATECLKKVQNCLRDRA